MRHPILRASRASRAPRALLAPRASRGPRASRAPPTHRALPSQQATWLRQRITSRRSHRRDRLAAGALGESDRPTPEAWFEPVATHEPTVLGTAGARHSSGPAAVVLAAALIAAVLASGGTVPRAERIRSARSPGRRHACRGRPAGHGRRPDHRRSGSAVVAVAKKVSPAVVTITSEGTTSSTDPLNPLQLPQTGVGSGVIFDANGWILTNRHVVDRQSATATSSSRTAASSPARSTASTPSPTSPSSRSTRPASRRRPIGDSSSIQVGQLAIAIGSPLGTYTNSVTSGIISATGRQIQVERRPTSTTSSRPTPRSTPATAAARSSTRPARHRHQHRDRQRTASGIGFAIPINIARPIMPQAVAGEKLARPYIGIRYQQIDAQAPGRRRSCP